jgi:hypothetical protein
MPAGFEDMKKPKKNLLHRVNFITEQYRFILCAYRNSIGQTERNRVLVIGAGPVGLRYSHPFFNESLDPCPR